MNKIITSFLIVVFGITLGFSQSETPDFTGDNFSLEGALALFKDSNSLEEFEEKINKESNNVNNLDLNNDDEIDYVVVEDIKDGDTHVIVLKTFLSENEKQDIATIGIEKTGNQEAQLQIIGDESLYAENSIVEPIEVVEKVSKSKGPSNFDILPTPVIVNVWFWPSVRFLYAPSYVAWVSPHRFGFYPRWWKPWKRYSYKVFYNRCAPHRVYYHKTKVNRIVVARKVYYPRRNTTTLVIKNRRNTTILRKNNSRKVTVNKSKNRPAKGRARVRR